MDLPHLNLPAYEFRIEKGARKNRIFDPIRKKYVILTPEEWVRQHFVQYLVQAYQYPAGLIAVETTLKIYETSRRCDIVVYSHSAEALAIVECKAPDVAITEKTFEQIALYNHALKVKHLIVTNGMAHYCCRIEYESQKFEFLSEIPAYENL